MDARSDARVAVVLFLLLLAVSACGFSPPPTGVPPEPPAPTSPPTGLPTPSGPLGVSLSVWPVQASAGQVEVTLTMANSGQEPVYLGICGPWEIYPEGDPDGPVWLGICEVDYLGHRVAPGEVFEGTLQAQLDAGNYRARVRVFGECTLGAPQEVSEHETNYGAFRDCAVTQEVNSAPIVVE